MSLSIFSKFRVVTRSVKLIGPADPPLSRRARRDFSLADEYNRSETAAQNRDRGSTDDADKSYENNVWIHSAAFIYRGGISSKLVYMYIQSESRARRTYQRALRIVSAVNFRSGNCFFLFIIVLVQY